MTRPAVNSAVVSHTPTAVPLNSDSLRGLPGPLPEPLRSPPHFYRQGELSLNSGARFSLSNGALSSYHRLSAVGRVHPHFIVRFGLGSDFSQELSFGLGLGASIPVPQNPAHRFDFFLQGGISAVWNNRGEALTPAGFRQDTTGQPRYEVGGEVHWNARINPLLSTGLFLGLSWDTITYSYVNAMMDERRHVSDPHLRATIGAEVTLGVYENRTAPRNNPDANFRWFRRINDRAVAMITSYVNGLSLATAVPSIENFQRTPYALVMSDSNLICGGPQAGACWMGLRILTARTGFMMTHYDHEDPNMILENFVHEQLHRFSSLLNRHEGRAFAYRVREENREIRYMSRAVWLEESLTELFTRDILHQNQIPYTPGGYSAGVSALEFLFTQPRFPGLREAFRRAYFSGDFTQVRNILGSSVFLILMDSDHIPNTGEGAFGHLLDFLRRA